MTTPISIGVGALAHIGPRHAGAALRSFIGSDILRGYRCRSGMGPASPCQGEGRGSEFCRPLTRRPLSLVRSAKPQVSAHDRRPRPAASGGAAIRGTGSRAHGQRHPGARLSSAWPEPTSPSGSSDEADRAGQAEEIHTSGWKGRLRCPGTKCPSASSGTHQKRRRVGPISDHLATATAFVLIADATSGPV
jgi:hypothetical protein